MLKHEHCEPAAPAKRDDNARVVGGTGSRPLCLTKWRQGAAGSPRCVGVAPVADRRAGGLCGSNLARAVGLNSPGVDATADFPGAALPSHCHSIDTARATD